MLSRKWQDYEIMSLWLMQRENEMKPDRKTTEKFSHNKKAAVQKDRMEFWFHETTSRFRRTWCSRTDPKCPRDLVSELRPDEVSWLIAWILSSCCHNHKDCPVLISGIFALEHNQYCSNPTIQYHQGLLTPLVLLRESSQGDVPQYCRLCLET